tara:strand:+ start:213 stop:485 length:273 start_codon:yes stop_codon:yes gene_type:complete
MINTIKVYPHTYMDRADGDHFKADHIASLVHKGVMSLLTNKLGSISYEDTSTNESYELALNNVDANTLDEIVSVFPHVSMLTFWNTKNSY